MTASWFRGVVMVNVKPTNSRKVGERFSKRLLDLMEQRGKLTTRGTARGPDVRGLKNAAGVTREMVRRYLNGSAMPRPDHLRRIAEWLEVDAIWLRDGVGSQQRLADEERELLDTYRQCSAAGRRFVMQAAAAAVNMHDASET